MLPVQSGLVLDHQVNKIGDVSRFVGSTVYVVDWNCSRQLMGLYVLRPDEFNVDEHAGGS